MAFPRPEPATRTRLADLLAAVAGLSDALVLGDESTVVTGVSLDSRGVRQGDLYAALPGAHAHGASFAAGAVDLGATAVLTDPAGAGIVRAAGLDRPLVVVDDPRLVLGEVARAVYGTADLPVRLVGITGTNGKTTTAHLVACALDALGRRTGLIGTVEIRIGEERVRSVRTTPEATDLHALLAVMAARGIDTCVMEVSSHALVMHRVDGVVYDLAVFTNLSQDHLDFHPTMRDYFAAKASLFTPERARRGIVCVDDAWGRELAASAAIPVTTLTSHPGVEADWVVRPDAADPARFTLSGPGAELSLRSALPGEFNRVNTAVAALVLLELGVAAQDAERAVLTDPHVPGRMERVRPSVRVAGRDVPTALVDYAHTPEAVAAALTALRPTTPGPLVVVLGAGGDRDRGKREAMGRAAAEHADVVIVTDDNPRSEDPALIRAAVLAGATAASTERGVEVLEVGDRAAAIRAAVRAADAGRGATVAVVGKGHETGQEVAGVVHHFDDREALRQALDEVLARPEQERRLS
ncbi:UDP-N-acetylmuramoyl-L-alanyl-D-glutamate--2,6-diaminopimelate ligase [Nostocoides japonicum T1-X7]|uniref:UDP-N-acetylmuramoyl-L-alanyl-D-glutamate--2,6-diaminopimelate ligase n=1 Tax=Nostocoides japonicum T1-X7 TaxID=1194083 RepID=A0A077M2U3_9MICO|nr:UDP-N-acetylmuramoyl-L-alanyl-D-glutamate--2,6-diaminopimelate ligase [Tetrasphaera japonica]CCH80111.1 UDP-N-acetylmuramoyl-L-alanyl-D-glutamate--2,6-diaminopimelate ligase [Tetrasphaera japonica T1-X7]